MTKELIIIIQKVKDKITDDSDVVWTGYDSAKQLRDELETYLENLAMGDTTCIEKLHTHFLPTGTFQEHSISNGWADEYLSLSENFDSIYATMKNHS
jgi:hypothetical protein